MVTATGPIPPLSGIAPTAPADEVQTTAALAPLTQPEGPDVTELSRLGALLSRLTDLQSTDPDMARRQLLAMSSELSGRAAVSGGDTQLRTYADAFARAAQTGNVADARPPGASGADDLAETAITNTATAQGQVAAYAQGQDVARPELQSFLDDALSQTQLEQQRVEEAAQRRTDQADVAQRTAEQADQRRTDQVEADQRAADLADERRVDQATLEERRTEEAGLEQRRLEQDQQRRTEEAAREQRRTEQAEVERRATGRAEQRRVEEATFEQRRVEETAQERRRVEQAAQDQQRVEQASRESPLGTALPRR